MTESDQKTRSVVNGLVVKFAIGCVLLGVMIAWQQYYFRAIDDVDGNGTTLWNWPAFLLIAFGIGALAFRIYRFAKARK
jgi:hypothetical protein